MIFFKLIVTGKDKAAKDNFENCYQKVIFYNLKNDFFHIFAIRAQSHKNTTYPLIYTLNNVTSPAPNIGSDFVLESLKACLKIYYPFTMLREKNY